MTKIKPFINKHNWEGINFSSEKNDWKTIEKNNVTIALNVLKTIFLLLFKKNSNYSKISSYYFNDSKRGKMALSCSKKKYQLY